MAKDVIQREQVTDPPSKARAVYDALSKDKKYAPYIPDTFEAFSEKLSNPEIAGSIYGTLSKDKKYAPYLPDSVDFVDIFKKQKNPKNQTPEEPTTIIDAPEDDAIASAEYEADGADDLLKAISPNPVEDIQNQVDAKIKNQESLKADLPDVKVISDKKQKSINLGVEQERLRKDINSQLSRGDITPEQAQGLMDEGIAKFQEQQKAQKKVPLLPDQGIVAQDAVKDIKVKKEIGTPSEELDKIIANELRKVDDKKYEDYTTFGLGLRQGIEMLKSVDDQLSIVKDNITISDNANKIAGINKLIDKYGKDHILSTEKTKKGIGNYSEPRTLGQMVKELEDENVSANKNAVEKYKSASKKLAKYQRSDIPKSIGSINDISDFGAFASSTLGQSFPQLAAAIGTFGTGTFMMETGMIQMQMIDGLIAENPKLTPEEIFGKSLTNSNWAIGGGIIAGSLDVISLGVIAEATGLTKVGFKLIGKGAKELAKKQTKKQIIKQIRKGIAHSTLSEAITEPLQGVVEGVSAAKGTGREYVFSQDQFLTDMLAGGVMGAGMAAVMGIAGRVVSNVVNKVKGGEISKTSIKEQSTKVESKPSQEDGSVVSKTETTNKKVDSGKEKIVEGVKETPPSKEDVSFADKAIKKVNKSEGANVLEKGILNFIKGGVFTDNFKEHVDRRESTKILRDSNPEFSTRMDEGKLRWNNLGKVTRPISMAKEMDLNVSEGLINKAKELEKFRVEKYRVEGKNALTNEEKIDFANKVTELAKDFAKENGLAEVADTPTESTKQKTEPKLGEFEQFTSIVNESKTPKEAFDKARDIKDVPKELSDKFSEKYNPDGKLSMEEAFNSFYNEVKKVNSGKENKKNVGFRVKEKKPKQTSKIKQNLEKKIEKTDETKQSAYIKRKMRDLRNTPEFQKKVKDIGDYTPHDRELADKEATKLVKEFQSEFGKKEGLIEAFKLLKNDDIPALMVGPLSAKLDTRMQLAGMEDKAIEVVDWTQKKGRDPGRLIASLRADASPESTVASILKTYKVQKQDALSKPFKEGQTYSEAFEEMKKRLSELEDAYKNLKEKGIKEEDLPEITNKKAKSKRAKELRERGRSLRKEGFAQLDKYFKAQKGTISMGLRVDNDLIGGLTKVFKGYLLEFGGNTLAAFEKFKTDTSKKYEITKEQLDSFKDNIFTQSKETIDEFKKEKQLQIVNNILKPEGKESKKERAERGFLAKDIVNAFNEKKSDSKALDLFALSAGFKAVSQESIKEILNLSSEYSDLILEGKGEDAKAVWDKLMFKLGDENIIKRSKTDLVQDLWYTGVLSALTTLARSIKGSGTSQAMFTSTRLLANPKVAGFAISQMVKGARGTFQNYWNVLATGQTDYNMTDFDPKLPQFTYEVTNREWNDLSRSKRAAKVLFSPVVYAFRNIPAFDQILGNIATEGNIAISEFNKTEGKRKDRIAEVKKRLAEDRVDKIREQVRLEIEQKKKRGKKINIGYSERRFREIRNEYRDRDAVKRALEDARIGSFVSTPKGTLGYVYNAWINAVEVKADDPALIKGGKLFIKGQFPFIRIFFNWANAGVEYTPLGAIRGLVKQSRWTKSGIEKMTKYERRELFVRSVLGTTVAYTIFSSMFRAPKDDEEGYQVKDQKDMWIEVHGPLTGKFYETESVNKDAKPWSFRFKLPDGSWSKYYLYRDNPIGFMMAPLGILYDESTINKFQKNKGKEPEEIRVDVMDTNYLMSQFANGILQYSADQTFNQGIKSFSDLVTNQGRDTKLEKAAKMALRPAEALINPGIYKQTYALYKAYQNIPNKQDRDWMEHAYKGIPIVNALIKEDAYDVFGYPIIKSFDVPFIPDFILEEAKENINYRDGLKEWHLLWKYENVVLAGFYPPEYINKYDLTSDDKDEYMKNAGLRMRALVMDAYDDLNELNAEDLQLELNSYKLEASEYALDILKSNILLSSGKKIKNR